ncbi:MAG: hypothetical protein R2856_25605 [Caldilineaceae bacterium]
MLYYPAYTYGVSERVKNVQIGALNPSDRFATFADWYILARRVPTNQMLNMSSTPEALLPMPALVGATE